MTDRPAITRFVCRFVLAIGLGAHARAAQSTPESTARTTAQIEAMIERAPDGDNIVVPPGVYAGHLRVRKPVTLDGRGQVTIDGGGTGNVVELLVSGVTFRGFRVIGSGSGVDHEPAGIFAGAGPVIIEDNHIDDALFGIDLRESPDSVVRRNTVRGKQMDPGRRGDGIRLWWSHSCTVEHNTVHGSRDMVFWYSEGLTIAHNTVIDSRYGLHFMYSHDTVLRDNTLTGNSVGVYLMYSNGIVLDGNRLVGNRGASGYGIGLKDCDDITLRGNAILANRVGIYLDNSPSSIDSTGLISGNLIAFNEMGMLATPITHGNVLTGNAFLENEEQAAVHGRGSLSLNQFASTDGVGNFWSDYAGFDGDHDGVGDLPHEPRSLFESLLAREPNLRLFLHSPAQQALEFTARAIPSLRPEPKFTDPSPLARMPEFNINGLTPQHARAPMAAFALSLLLLACGCAWAVCREGSEDGLQRARRVL